ncbi:MAG: SET domain-containing protein-lysine N-methyltransferase, partial [Legionella sp.]
QELLTENKDITRFELRYIHPLVGLGVYARVAIKKGERIASYSGIKRTANTSCSNYLFSLNQDCLNMELDAESHGNISRFINHAPVDSPAGSDILTANVVADNQLSHGLQWVVYYAQKDIAVGEQLLVCYGSNYFKHQTARNFSANGFVVDDNNKRIKANKQQQLKQYRIMADHGIKTAQYYIIGRISLIIFAVILATLSLNGLMT